MSLLGSIGHFLKNPIQPITHAVGKTVGVTANTKNGIHVDPAKLALTAGALALPGVGSLVGHVPGVSSLGGALKEIPGVSSIAEILGGSGDPGRMPDLSYDPDTGMVTGGAAGSGGGGLLSDISGFLTGNGGRNALGIMQGVNAAQLGQKSNQFANDAVNSAQSAYAAKAPLRVAGIQGLLNPQTQDLSSLTNSRNGLNTSTAKLQSIASLLNPSNTTSQLQSIQSANPFARVA